MKQFVDKIKPILKLEWCQIKKSNEENFEQIIKQSKNDEHMFNSKNIIVIIDNLGNFLTTIETPLFNLIPGFEIAPIINILEDIRNYTIMLLKKNQMSSINQYNIINTCCDLNDKIMDYVKKNKVNFDFLSILKDMRNSCSKLLFEYNPK